MSHSRNAIATLRHFPLHHFLPFSIGGSWKNKRKRDGNYGTFFRTESLDTLDGTLMPGIDKTRGSLADSLYTLIASTRNSRFGCKNFKRQDL